MKTTYLPSFHRLLPGLLLVVLIASASGDQFDHFTYRVNDDDTVTITGFPRDAVGHVTIPAEIEGKPITIIGYNSFSGCIGLTSVSIPDSVTTIGDSPGYPADVGEVGAFRGCIGLVHVTIPDSVTILDEETFADCTGLRSVTLSNALTVLQSGVFANCTSLETIEIPSSVRAIRGVILNSYVNDFGFGCNAYGTGAFANCRSLTELVIPEGVVTIGAEAFAGCRELTRITIPSTVTSLGDRGTSFGDGESPCDFFEGNFFEGNSLFSGCDKLRSAVFLGHAPSVPTGLWFSGALGTPDVTLFYLSTSNGFDSEPWTDHPAVVIDVDQYPTAAWLLAHGLTHDTDLQQDLNGDGVTLLMAYALDLDPKQNLAGRLPVPTVDGESLRMSFHGTSPGITYIVQTSTDLQHWATESVTTSEPDADGLRTATVPRDTPQRFLRLVVE